MCNESNPIKYKFWIKSTKLTILFFCRPNNGESWNSPQASLPHQHPQAHHPTPLACVSEESEVVTSSNDATTGLVDISHDIGGHSDLSHDIGGHNDLSSSAGGSVYGRRNPWGNQSYADLITQVIDGHMTSWN